MGQFNTVDHVPTDPPKVKPGIYLATVVGNLDRTYMGILDVRIHRAVGGGEVEGQTVPVKYMSPFLGTTSIKYVTDNNDYNSTQKSYGMWMVPPDVGTTVIVVWAEGNPKYGYWIGCVPDENMNFMIPGIAATDAVVEGGGRLPVAEYNKVSVGTVTEPTKVKKPVHPFSKQLETQGLVKDDVRGITSSSARREAPSMVFGISTPGPIDKKGPKGKVGKENSFANAFISRLGGTTFVMDDGDDKLLRKTPASEGPPEYASIEQNETGGQTDIPHNELVRIRTRTGHQILLHNSEDLIYIGNAKGTTWIEMTSNGKIDIFAEDSISIHTKNDMNFKADRDINLEAGRNVNIKGAKVHAEASADVEVIAGADTKISSTGTSHINSKEHRETAGKIYMNSDQAAVAATKLSTCTVPTEAGGTITSIMNRVPTHEPWPHHENLDPANFVPAKTDRDAGASIAVPTKWKTYSATEDTFKQFAPTTKSTTGGNT